MFMQFSARSGDQGMRAFVVMLPSGVRYWTVLDEELAVVPVADGFLRQVRFGRDGAESTTKRYAGSIALFLPWGAPTGGGGRGGGPARGAARIHEVVAGVRGMDVDAVAAGAAAGPLVRMLYEIADDRDLPGLA